MALTRLQRTIIDDRYDAFVRVVSEGENLRETLGSFATPEQRRHLSPAVAAVGITNIMPISDDAYAKRVCASLDAVVALTPVTPSFRFYITHNVMRQYRNGMPQRVVLWFASRLLDPFNNYSQSPFNATWAPSFEVFHFNDAQDSYGELFLHRWEEQIMQMYKGVVRTEHGSR